MILQPLVENAVRHAVAGRVELMTIRLSSRAVRRGIAVVSTRSPFTRRIAIPRFARDDDAAHLVLTDEIDYVIADGDYVRVFAGRRQLLLRLTMNRIETALPAHEHVRIHQSAIVNLSRVRRLEALPNAEVSVVLRSGVTLRASRSYAERLRLALGVIQPPTATEG